MSEAVAVNRLAHHFATLEKQNHASRLGMWLFLATEILLFAGLFVSYAMYRYLYPATFESGSRPLNVTLGTVNTVVLITSSFTVAMAHHWAHHGKNRLTFLMLILSIGMALMFLVVKGVEWHEEFEKGALPGQYYALADLQAPGANLFFTHYFLMTGLHGLHVIIGMAVLGWCAVKALKGQFSEHYSMPVELGGMYWHLVDLVWIFLYPLLYLI